MLVSCRMFGLYISLKILIVAFVGDVLGSQSQTTGILSSMH
jgi:hypothetical protein